MVLVMTQSLLPPVITKTFAELTIEEKSGISHRGLAVKQLADVFEIKNPQKYPL